MNPRTVLDRLTSAPWEFDFFAAVRAFLADRTRRPVGTDALPDAEAVRFRGHPSLAFPPSQLHALTPPTADRPVPLLTVTFFGLCRANGVLPTHYTQALIPTVTDDADTDHDALRDWFDLFNHRFVSFFYRAWEKYRFYVPFERGEYRRTATDPFTLAIRGLMGFATPGLTRRLVVRGGGAPAEDYRWSAAGSDRAEPAAEPLGRPLDGGLAQPQAAQLRQGLGLGLGEAAHRPGQDHHLGRPTGELVGPHAEGGVAGVVPGPARAAVVVRTGHADGAEQGHEGAIPEVLELARAAAGGTPAAAPVVTFFSRSAAATSMALAPSRRTRSRTANSLAPNRVSSVVAARVRASSSSSPARASVNRWRRRSASAFWSAVSSRRGVRRAIAVAPAGGISVKRPSSPGRRPTSHRLS